MKPLRTFSTDRLELCKQFLRSCSMEEAEPSFLAGDASARTYYRLYANDNSYVLMDAPPPVDCQPFTHVSKLLRTHGFSAPEILAENTDTGFLLLEDFGDSTYSSCLNNAHAAEPLYQLAVDNLTALHKEIVQQPSWCENYTADLLWQEAELYVNWYWPKVKGRECEAVQSLHEICHTLAEQALVVPQRLVLRDYHVDNLMLLTERQGISQCGLLDFQDAIWGPVIFDFVSLIEDARRDVPDQLNKKMWQRFLSEYPKSHHDKLYQSGIILSTLRHMKILGIFARLAYRDNKQHYLQHLPRIRRLLRRCLEHEFMHPLKNWFAEHDSDII